MSESEKAQVNLEEFREKLSRVDLRHWEMCDFADYFDVSRHTLHTRLRKQGTTFFRELQLERRRRIEHHEGKADAEDLARVCGFSGPANLCRAFRILTGDSFRNWKRSRGATSCEAIH